MLRFVHEGSPARVVFGAGRRQQLPAEVERLGIERALLITTPSQRTIALELDLPIIALPTTYSGSEMTAIQGLTEDGIKRTFRDPRMLPRTVIYDPELTLTLPPSVAGPSGMNAMAHCVEALYIPRSPPRRVSGRWCKACPKESMIRPSRSQHAGAVWRVARRRRLDRRDRATP